MSRVKTAPDFVLKENLRRNRALISLTSEVLSRVVEPSFILKVRAGESTITYEAWGVSTFIILENGALLNLSTLNLTVDKVLTKRYLPEAWFDKALLSGVEFISVNTQAFVEEFVVKPLLKRLEQ